MTFNFKHSLWQKWLTFALLLLISLGSFGQATKPPKPTEVQLNLILKGLRETKETVNGRKVNLSKATLESISLNQWGAVCGQFKGGPEGNGFFTGNLNLDRAFLVAAVGIDSIEMRVILEWCKLEMGWK